MAERYRSTRQPGKRQPLVELHNRANHTPPIQHRDVPVTKTVPTGSPQIVLPHNESLEPNGTLTVRSSSSSGHPEHNRLSQVAVECERDSKRNSAVSTVSTDASTRRRKAYIGHWQLGRTIGKGGCSRVRVVRHKTTHQYGAVKIITRTTAESTRAQSLANLIESTKSSQPTSGYRPIPYGLEREIAVMKLLEHPNIVRLYDVWENRNELYLIMEYVDGGELFHYVDDRKGLHEDESVYIFRQIVAALLYCHRLLICHRDLKPENILLNQKDLTVKLIDFGMAALQPEGRLLSTPCGSPHYAAPEVVSSQPYDGKQADVWSCGVILYVMLTGTTPYNYSPEGDIRVLFRDIARARYSMPSWLSPEAQDLIERIFVPNPKRRITMDEIWDHPLLHKYDKDFGLDGPQGSKEAAIGPIPMLRDFKLKRVPDIDREILRNMRTLWHSEPEQGLIQKLLNNEINQEKLFYAALIKHREENLENYSGLDDMDYSRSDYHHNQMSRASDTPPVPTIPAQRTQSQYSIMNDEHLRSSPSLHAPPPSVSSYDPYRASKDPIVDARGEYINVVVHRQASSSTRKAPLARPLRHPNALRVEMLRQGGASKRRSNMSSSSLARSAKSRSSMQRSSMSRHSISSAGLPSSPPVIAKMRPSDLHKRGVSFNHMRRASMANALPTPDHENVPPTPSLPDTFRGHRRPQRPSNPEPPSSSSPPQTPSGPPVRSRKERAVAVDVGRIKIRHGDTPSQHIRNDIRIHSVELEKACEEAFFRTSVGSSLTAHTNFSEKVAGYETPPSSVSARGSGGIERFEPKTTPRTLPEPPKDTPNTYLTRTLEETRDKLAAYKSSGDENAAKFDEVLRMLENIMPGSAHPGPNSKRIASAPNPKTSEPQRALPIISEETNQRALKDSPANNWRSVTAPVPLDRKPDDKTIRIVPSSSLSGTIAPLNVRKSVNTSDLSVDCHSQSRVTPSPEQLPRAAHTNEGVTELSSIDENAALTTVTTAPLAVRKKRSAWFGLSKKQTEHETKSSFHNKTSNAHQETDKPLTPRKLSKQPPEQPQGDEPPPSAQSSEFPMRKKQKSKRFAEGAKDFTTRWLGRKDAPLVPRQESKQFSPRTHMQEPSGSHQATEAANTDSATQRNRSLDSLFGPGSPALLSEDSQPTSSNNGPERSWFARFFHLKPPAKILCFSIPRSRARQELVILLKEWQRHGIRDLQYSRQTNTISARVDRVNALEIKPVSFKIELFVVLEHGRKVGLSIARFIQVKGAASGFKRVMEVVDGVMRGRGWLIEDEEKWKALCDVVGGGGSG